MHCPQAAFKSLGARNVVDHDVSVLNTVPHAYNCWQRTTIVRCRAVPAMATQELPLQLTIGLG
jgi:hypothetical protein